MVGHEVQGKLQSNVCMQKASKKVLKASTEAQTILSHISGCFQSNIPSTIQRTTLKFKFMLPIGWINYASSTIVRLKF